MANGEFRIFRVADFTVPVTYRQVHFTPTSGYLNDEVILCMYRKCIEKPTCSAKRFGMILTGCVEKSWQCSSQSPVVSRIFQDLHQVISPVTVQSVHLHSHAGWVGGWVFNSWIFQSVVSIHSIPQRSVYIPSSQLTLLWKMIHV